MAKIWAEVLRLDRVGVLDSLFELGGDSLHVFQITSRANKAGLAVTPRLILRHRTIRGILAELKTGNAAAQPAQMTIKPIARQKYRLDRLKQGDLTSKG